MNYKKTIFGCLLATLFAIPAVKMQADMASSPKSGYPGNSYSYATTRGFMIRHAEKSNTVVRGPASTQGCSGCSLRSALTPVTNVLQYQGCATCKSDYQNSAKQPEGKASEYPGTSYSQATTRGFVRSKNANL